VSVDKSAACSAELGRRQSRMAQEVAINHCASLQSLRRLLRIALEEHPWDEDETTKAPPGAQIDRLDDDDQDHHRGAQKQKRYTVIKKQA